MKLEDYKHIHFIGIGGIGMSGLARLFLHEGKAVSGSDSAESENTKKLIADGAAVVYEQVADNITDEIDFVVYTEAMSQDHPELVAAREQGKEIVNYFEALGMVANDYYLIAIAGTHGKSTTTAMAIDIFEEASLDPSAIVGSLRSKTGSNYRAGKSKYMIVEACEYKRDFLTLEPDVLVITNLEHEHVDYYKDLADVQGAFRRLAQKVPADGKIICDTSDANVQPVLEVVQAEVIDYRQYVDPLLELKQPGMHNRLNAAAAIAAAETQGVERKIANDALYNFAGIGRRFEYKGKCNSALVYDEYAHHPTEIEASIAGARELYPQQKITVVFQPHTYSRTHELFDDFVAALSKADRVLLVPIYAAREENESGVESDQLVEKLSVQGTDAMFFHTLEAAALQIKESVTKDDIVIAMGAGDVTKIATDLTQ